MKSIEFNPQSPFLEPTVKKIYYLHSCSTCQRILKEIHAWDAGYQLQDIGKIPLSPSQLEEMKKLAGSYEALFSRRAIKYRELDLQDKKLSERDYRRLILQEYSFLKRPVIILGDQIFIGSDKKNIQALRKATL